MRVTLLCFILWINSCHAQKTAGFLGAKNIFAASYSPGINTFSILDGNNVVVYKSFYSLSYHRIISNKHAIGFERTYYDYNTTMEVTPMVKSDIPFKFESYGLLWRMYKMRKASIAPIGKYFEIAPQIARTRLKGPETWTMPYAVYKKNYRFGLYFKTGIKRALAGNLMLDIGIRYGFTFNRDYPRRGIQGEPDPMRDLKINSLFRYYLSLGFCL